MKRLFSRTSKDWWRGAVVYQIYPRSFRDSNGDGIGDLNGIIEKLDYLNDGTPKSLGIDAIWLSPIYPSPMHDFGYDISDFNDIDSIFGDLKTFKKLLKECHKRGIKVIMDLVVNHTSNEHPWFIESRSSRENAKRDWYIWRDGKNGRAPNNWLAFFGGSGWTFDSKSKQYYYHAFLPEQPDLNWRNPEVEKAVFKMISYWLDMGVDGFRLDVVNLYFKDERLRENPTYYTKLARPFDRQNHLYDRNQREMHPLLRRFRKLLDSYGKRTSVGEVTLEAGQDSAIPASFQGEDDELHMSFNFAFFFAKWDANHFRKVILHWENSLKGNSWPCYTLSNHDFKRHISRYATGDEAETIARAKVAAAMLITLRGTPFLYYGEEIGMREQPVSRSEMKDPVGKRYWPLHPGRDGCRRPMPWNDSYTTGFTTGMPWLPLYTRSATENVENQNADHHSLLSFYRNLIWLRKNNQTLIHGSLEILEGVPSGVLAYRRESKKQRVLILLHFTKNVEQVSLEKQDTGRVLFSTHNRRGRIEQLVTLLPYEIVICDCGK